MASPARSRTRSIFCSREWNNKAAGFVSYGGAGGARAVEQLRLGAGGGANRHRAQPGLALPVLPTSKTSASSSRLLTHEKSVGAMFDQLTAWISSSKTLREVTLEDRCVENNADFQEATDANWRRQFRSGNR